MSPADKLREQLQELGTYVESLLAFPAGKLFLALLGVWWSWFFSPTLQIKLLAWIPVLWGMDFITGTALAIKTGRWTFRDLCAGVYRGGAWMIVLVMAYGLSVLLGDWLFIAMVVSVFTTEAASVCDNVIGFFPESELMATLRSLLRLVRRRTRFVKKQIDAATGEPEEPPAPAA